MTDAVLVDPLEQSATRATLRLKPPPLHLMYLGASLRQDGYDVRLMEDNLDQRGPEGTAREVVREDPLIVGITAATATVNEAYRYAEEIKRECPNAKIVMGGPHVTFLSVETLQECPALDAVCVGEGEATICELMSRAEAGKGLEDVKGIAYRDDGRIVQNGPRELIKDIDSIPEPARDLLDMKRCVDQNGEPIGTIVTSRGCVFGCNYCASSRIMGRRFRARRPEKIVDELESVSGKYGIEYFEFLDDNFVLDRRRAIAVAREIRNRGLDIGFVASSRVDTIDRELLGELRSSGLNSIYYGIESGCQRVLDLMNKGIRVENAVDAVKDAKEEKVRVVGSFILGYPGETLEEMNETVRHAISLDVDMAQFSLLTPYPGTPIWESLRKDGLLADCGFDQYTVLDPVVDYEKLGISTKAVSRKLIEAYARFYLRPSYLLRNPEIIRMAPRVLIKSLKGMHWASQNKGSRRLEPGVVSPS